MANIKIIDLPTGSPESTSFVEATQVDELAESGRSTVKLALNALGNYVAGQGASPLEYGNLETESTTLIGAANELHNTIGADAYDDTATYAEGELCIYNNTLYVCTVSGGITTPEAWTAAHWTATTIETLIAAKADSSDVYKKSEVNNLFSSMNIKSVIRVTATVTTGATGNIPTDIINDGKHYITGCFVAGVDYVLTAWVSSTQNKWFMTARGAGTWSTVNNQEINIRYWIVELYNA